MNAAFSAFDKLHFPGEAATQPIVRFAGRLAVLLLVAGSGHAPRRALPDIPKTAHSATSNCRF